MRKLTIDRTLAGVTGALPPQVVAEAIFLLRAELASLQRYAELMQALGSRTMKAFRAQVAMMADARERAELGELAERIEALNRTINLNEHR